MCLRAALFLLLAVFISSPGCAGLNTTVTPSKIKLKPGEVVSVKVSFVNTNVATPPFTIEASVSYTDENNVSHTITVVSDEIVVDRSLDMHTVTITLPSGCEYVASSATYKTEAITATQDQNKLLFNMGSKLSEQEQGDLIFKVMGK